MVHRSRSSAVAVPPLSWAEYFLDRTKDYAGRTALIDPSTGAHLDYEAVRGQIESVASSLAARGYGKGDVFAIFAANCAEYVVAFQAVLRLGGVVTTINPLHTADELGRQLRHSRAVCLFTVPELLDTAVSALEGSAVHDLFVFGGGSERGFEQLLRPPETEAVPLPAVQPEKDVAVLPYSSGTTGLPKGVMLTHRNLVAHNVQLQGQEGASTLGAPGDRVLAVLPLFHIFGMTVIMNHGLSSGATLVLMRVFEPERFLQLIEEYRITHAFLVPPLVLFLAGHPLVEQYDISSLRYVCSGAAPLGAPQIRAASQRIGCHVVQGYGLTESSPVTHLMADQRPPLKDGSIGDLLPNTEAVIVDPATDVEVPPNTPGELLVRGPQVMRGYLNDPEATANTIDRDGWLHTGDVAYVDEEGDFFVVDRLKEMIKYKAYQVAPAEIEALLLRHPAVSDAAVVPVPDTEAGEVPKAFVATREAVSPEDLMAWVADHVAPYKRIREVAFVDQIPRSPSGKILRRMLREA